MKSIKAAVVQAAPVLFDKEATIEKACALVQEAGAEGADIVLLPEAFVPAYPRGLTFGIVMGDRSEPGRALWQRYWDNAVDIPGPEITALGRAAKDASVFLAIGIIERDSTFSRGTLYCTLAYFGPDGTLLGKHRKLRPTAAERLIWGEGDGSTLPVFETDLGRIGGLICWENYMPLARMALYGRGVELYLAPTADPRDTWQATMKHIACEGRCFVLGCNQFVTKDMYPADLPMRHELDALPDVMCRGGSVIVSPYGAVLSGPLFDREGILYADLDMTQIVRSRLDLDVAGHYARADVFRLHVNTAPLDPVRYEAAPAPDDRTD